MLTMFKVYCKDMVIGATVGASIGGAAGAAAGKMGLNQLCNNIPYSDSSCNSLIAYASHDAVQMGAATGAAVGFGIGMFLYPMFRGIKKMCCGDVEVTSPSLASSDSLGWTVNNP